MIPSAPTTIGGPTTNPSEAAESRITRVSDLPSVWTMDDSVEWLVEGIIPRGSVVLFSADSGTGKTWLAHAIAGAVARGERFIERKVQQAPVLYLDGENPLCVVKRNLTDLGIQETPDLHVWAGWNVEPPPGPDDSRIIDFVRQYKPLLIWDSLVEFNPGDEQSSTEVRKFMKFFRSLAHEGATIIVLHHTGKSRSSEQYRGSSDIKASVDMAYLVTGNTLNGKVHQLFGKPFKSRIAPGQKFGVEFHEGQGFVAIGGGNEPTAAEASQVVRDIVIANPKSNATHIKNLAKSRGVSKGKVDEILRSPEFQQERGKGAEKLYWVETGEVLAEPLPDFPNPRVQETGKSQEPS